MKEEKVPPIVDGIFTEEDGDGIRLPCELYFTMHGRNVCLVAKGEGAFHFLWLLMKSHLKPTHFIMGESKEDSEEVSPDGNAILFELRQTLMQSLVDYKQEVKDDELKEAKSLENLWGENTESKK